MKIIRYKGGYDRNFMYLLISGKEAVVVDCFEAERVGRDLKEYGVELKYIMSTHSHFDHVEGNAKLKEMTGAKIVMQELNECDVSVREGSFLKFGDDEIEVLHTPGHTADAVCFLVNGKLFTGDTLFVGCVGGHFYDKSEKTQPQSLRRLMRLPEETVVYPGHDYGKTETSTIGEEMRNNPFLLELL